MSLPKKIYRLKEDQAFSLSLELGRREKFAGHPSADFLLHSVGGGSDFVDTVNAFQRDTLNRHRFILVCADVLI
jgi:hypothetical protein